MLETLQNLGPKSAHWLRQAGIETETQLRNFGAAGAYLKVARQQGRGVSLNLLWAIEGALENKHWTDISDQRKSELLKAVRD